MQDAHSLTPVTDLPRRGLSSAEAVVRAERLVRTYAARGEYRLVADEVVLANLVRGLARNWVQHGLPFCPCKPVSGDLALDRRVVCPCKDHHQEIARDGTCCCGLYVAS
jgi:ferredoxin-thioredoxin reductase catalytic chain